MSDPFFDSGCKTPAGPMFDYGTSSLEAKQAWQRGFDLAHPGPGRPSPLLERMKEIADDHGGNFATIDGLSLDQAYEEASHMDDECQTAMALGFLHGVLAKAEGGKG